MIRHQLSLLLGRFSKLQSSIMARELPFLLDPETSTFFEEEDADRPLGAVIGTIDLLYRDPDTSQLVVADWKTDRVTDAAALRERARHYVPQGRIYLEAVQKAFPEEGPPRFELWFLQPDRIVPVLNA